MRLKKIIYIACFIFSPFIGLTAANIHSYTFSVNIYDISLIRINPSTSFNLNLLSTEAGGSMTSITNKSTYLQLTSIPPAGKTRRITTIISSGNIPAGTMLTLLAVKKTGVGDVGITSSILTLNKTANQTLIDGIASGYTGTNTMEGFELNYTLQVNPATYSQLKATQSMSITITYTIANNP